jgi:hypothetical protein
MMEAALAIGDYGAAELNLNRYISDPGCDAFEPGSTLRQLRQIWQLSAEQGPGATLLPKLQAALLQRQGGSIEPTHGELASIVAARGSDRGPAGPDFQQLEWYRTALLRAASVARIETPAVRGTGFLVKATDFFPRTSDDAIVLLTAAHVLSEPGSSQPALETASPVFEAQARAFRLGCLLCFSPADQLDAAFLTVEGLAPDAPFCPMPSPSRRSETPPQRVYVIGYPGGGALSFSLQDGLLLDSDATHFHYRAATQPGSGGSPVFRWPGLDLAGYPSRQKLTDAHAERKAWFLRSWRRNLIARHSGRNPSSNRCANEITAVREMTFEFPPRV